MAAIGPEVRRNYEEVIHPMKLFLPCRSRARGWLRAVSGACLLLEWALRAGPSPIPIRLTVRNAPRDR